MGSVASKLVLVRRADKALVLVLAIAATLAASLLVLAVATRPAEAAFPGTNGKIVFSSNRPAPDGSTDYEIYMMNADGTGLTQLTNHAGPDREPTYSSDGSRIAFVRDDKIWLMNADGSNQAPLTSSTTYTSGSDPTFSPDGSTVAFVMNQSDIVVMNADGSGTLTRLTRDSLRKYTPAFSPDGSKIAFAIAPDSSRDSHDIFVMNADGSGTPTRLTYDAGSKPGDPRYHDYAPAWSPDGSKIAFHTQIGNDLDISVTNSDGSGQYRLFDLVPGTIVIDPNCNCFTGTDSGIQANPAFSPDGSKIVFRRNDDIFMGPADGKGTNRDGSGTPTSVTSGSPVDTEPDWGPLSFDLSLAQSDTPDPVKVNNNLTYTLEVTNDGFDAAPGVVLTDRLPSGVTFVSASAGCINAVGKVTCKLGSVPGVSPRSPAGTTVRKTITVTPTAQGTITNTASVESSAREVTYTGNNSDRESTDVTLNRAPVANEDSYVTREDTPLTISAPGVLSDDTDADGDPLTVASVLETTSAGTLTHNANGSFTYTPSNNSNGADAFTYKATDGTAQSNAATVTIVVRAVNDAPSAADDSAQTEKDTPLDVDVLSNDRDAERDEISITNVSDPAHGTAALNSDGAVRYVPDAGYTGSDPFTYDLSDGNGGTDTATVNVTVSDTKAPMVKSVKPLSGAKNVSATTTVTAVFSEAMAMDTLRDPGTGRSTTFVLKKGTAGVAAKVSYDPQTRTAILDPDRKLRRGATYTATVTTGATDLAGNALDGDPGLPGEQPKTWKFTVKR